jgi:hypothetical protein
MQAEVIRHTTLSQLDDSDE